MPSSDTQRVLVTMASNVALAREFLGDQTPEAFARNAMSIYAVTRCLEIISEASRRLPDDLKRRHPLVPWARVAGAGNVYRQDYEDVASSLIWNTVHVELDGLAAAVDDELTKI